MSTRAQKYSAARAWAHDHVCMSSDCKGDTDHARRTQSDFAALAIGKQQPAEAIHRLMCMNHRRGECVSQKHVEMSGELAVDLATVTE